MGKFEDELATIGTKQFVKNIFADELRNHRGKPYNHEKFMQDLNDRLFADFKVIANEAVDELLKKASALMEKKDA